MFSNAKKEGSETEVFEMREIEMRFERKEGKGKKRLRERREEREVISYSLAFLY